MIETYVKLIKDMDARPGARSAEQAGLEKPDWYALGAIAGLFGGIVAALMGSLLTSIEWFTATGARSSHAHALGTMLLLLTIPLLMCGAHCLDLAERRNSKESDSPSHEN